MSAASRGYADRPIVKPAVWTWEVPVYFFVGGCAGMAGLIAGVVHLLADAGGELDASLAVVSRALWIAVVGAVLSPPLLISDLGRPRRFLNMLRRFNRRSALSVGVWILIVFSASATAALWLHGASSGWVRWPPAPGWLLELRGPVLAVLAVFGGLLATYTGVLLAATVLPVWNRHRGTLPIHFGMASLASASAWMVVTGVESSPVLRVMTAATVLDGVLEATMRWSRGAARGGGPRGSSWVSPLAVASGVVACVALGLPGFGAVAVLVAGLMGRFHWVGLGSPRAAVAGASEAAPAERGSVS